MKKMILAVLVAVSASMQAMELEPGKKQQETLEQQVAQALKNAQEETSQSTQENNIWKVVTSVRNVVHEKGSQFFTHISAVLKERELERGRVLHKDDTAEGLYINIEDLSEKNRDFMLKFYLHLKEQQEQEKILHDE